MISTEKYLNEEPSLEEPQIFSSTNDQHVTKIVARAEQKVAFSHKDSV